MSNTRNPRRGDRVSFDTIAGTFVGAVSSVSDSKILLSEIALVRSARRPSKVLAGYQERGVIERLLIGRLRFMN